MLLNFQTCLCYFYIIFIVDFLFLCGQRMWSMQTLNYTCRRFHFSSWVRPQNSHHLCLDDGTCQWSWWPSATKQRHQTGGFTFPKNLQKLTWRRKYWACPHVVILTPTPSPLKTQQNFNLETIALLLLIFLVTTRSEGESRHGWGLTWELLCQLKGNSS